MAKRTWEQWEEDILKKYYDKKTTMELSIMLPDKTVGGINSKIKRLKQDGFITREKSVEAVYRAYKQRGKKIFFTVNQ